MIINIAKDFSRLPCGRFKTDGPYSAEEFRDNLLIPALNQNKKVTVLLDETRGYGSSFLEEAFGGLIRKNISIQTIHNKMILVSKKDRTLIKEINLYIESAAKEVKPMLLEQERNIHKINIKNRSHKIPIGSLVEIDSTYSEEEGLRLYVCGYGFNSNGEPLYNLTFDKNLIGKDPCKEMNNEEKEAIQSCLLIAIGSIARNFNENSLKIIKQPKNNQTT